MAQESFKQVLVTNSPTLLAEGATVEALGVGQVGIIDAKTNRGVTAPTYANNKAIKFVWGTPDLKGLPLMSGVPNENEYSKLIKGKLLKDFRGVKSKQGHTEIWTVGNTGDAADTTNTLFAKPGEVKHLYIKLTGGPIDKLFSRQGITRQFSTVVRTTDPDCADPCANVDCRLIAEDLVKQINSDPLIGKSVSPQYGKQPLVKASVIEQCADPDPGTTDTDYIFELRVCDTKDDIALGIVQAQYPDDVVKKVGFEGSFTVYQIIRDTDVEPDAFTNEDFSILPDCDVCPSGYTLVTGGFAYKIVREDANSGAALTQVRTDYGLSGDEVTSRVNYEFGSSTYIVTSTTELTPFAATDQLTFLGDAQNTCVLSDPTETEWAGAGTLTKYGKEFRLTIADECDDNQLTAIQEAYPDLTISIVDADGDCVHTYTTTVFSNAVEEGCSQDQLEWTVPQAFKGIEWQPVTTLPDEGDCLCGIKLEVPFVNRITGECTYDYFPYEAETIHIQVSQFNPDYNGTPDANEEAWAVTKIQGYQHPIGFGANVRKHEQKSKSYTLRERSFDPVVREIEGYSFQADPYKYYDEYILEFDFVYQVGGWSEKYNDSYKLHVYFPAGQGKAFETAVNGYISSAGILIDPVVL